MSSICHLLKLIDKQDRKQPILPPSKSANRQIREPIIPTFTANAAISSVNEVKYAQPGAMYQPPLNPQEVLPPSVSSQYQGLNASGVDMISAYNVPQVRKYEHSGEITIDPKYANLPM